MRVRYFIDIIEGLLAKGVSQSAIAKALGFKKQNITEIIGKTPDKQRRNLKDEHLPGLLALCKKHGVGPRSADQLVQLIQREKRAELKK